MQGGRQDGNDAGGFGLKDESLWGGLKAAWACKPYVILNITYLWTWLSFQVLASNLILYLCYAIDVFDQFECAPFLPNPKHTLGLGTLVQGTLEQAYLQWHQWHTGGCQQRIDSRARVLL
jgi:hypothetical protein